MKLPAVCCVLCLMVSGCVQRSLTIRSDPPGALVYMNDAPVGTTPVTYDFTWYGWYRLRILKDGYEQLHDHRLLRAPAYLWIPLDLAMELLPGEVRDDRTWSYTLTPLTGVPVPRRPSPLPLREQPVSSAPDGGES